MTRDELRLLRQDVTRKYGIAADRRKPDDVGSVTRQMFGRDEFGARTQQGRHFNRKHIFLHVAGGVARNAADGLHERHIVVLCEYAIHIGILTHASEKNRMHGITDTVIQGHLRGVVVAEILAE